MRVFVAGATTGGLVKTETDPLDFPVWMNAAEQDRAA